MTTRLGGEEDDRPDRQPDPPWLYRTELRWIQENEPEVYPKSPNLLPKDYPLQAQRLTDARRVGQAFDVQQRHWSRYIINEFEWPEAWLPTVTESPEASTKLSAEAASLLGSRGHPIIAGVATKPPKRSVAGSSKKAPLHHPRDFRGRLCPFRRIPC